MGYFSFLSSLNDKRSPDARLASRHSRISEGLAVGEGSEKKIRCDNDLRKVYQKLTSTKADTENVALLTECSQYTGGALYLLPGLLARNC